MKLRDRVKELRRVRAGDLVPHSGNWRMHPKAQVAALKGLLSQVGFAGAILTRKLPGGKLQIIDGHARKDLDADALLPCLVTDLSAKEADLLLATYDPLGAMAGRDQEALSKLLASVHAEDEALQKMLDALGGGGATSAGETDPDEVPTGGPKVKAGETWKLGAHRLYVGSCEKLAAKFGEKSVDLIVSDPPYGVSYADKNRFLNAVGRGNRIQKPIEDDHHTTEEMEKLWTTWFTSVRPMLRDGASYYVTGPQGGDLLLLLLLSLRASGFPLRHMLVWAKNNHVLGRSDYHYQHEPIIYGWVDGSHHKVKNRSETSLWQIDKPQKSDLHPTMKPVELYVRAIQNSTDRGATVLDAFMGSGTMLIAAEQTERKAIGSETDLHYASVAIKRWSDFTGKKAVRA